jgi:predicted TIM-barrel fold metal-dependent hydrolase
VNGVDHVCLVALTVYGTDNSYILDGLTRLKGKGRAVVCIDPDTVTDEELSSMHALGARGARLNLRTRGDKLERRDFEKVLLKYANRIRSFGWVLQIYTSLDQIALIAPIIPSLGIPVVFDHLGSPEGNVPPKDLPGYADLMKLLEGKIVYVKLSAVYRFPDTPGMEEYVKGILRVAPTQVVWASDWPHTGGVSKNPGGDRKCIQDYRKVSIPEFVATCKSWCDHDEDLMRKIWVDNPRRLWQYDDAD